MIGCVVLVRHEGKIVGLECGKGRGTILPGGKWKQGETFVECARRELFEETGLVGSCFRLLFAGEAEEGYFTYAFHAHVADYFPVNSLEGKVVLTDWETLKQSKFGCWYELLEMVI